jgi:sigma-B regulation protein RsbU (phosphoserine phosphatase)
MPRLPFATPSSLLALHGPWRRIFPAQFPEEQLDSTTFMSSALPHDSGPSVHSREFFDFLLEKTPDQVYFKDRRGRFLRASRAVANYLDAADPNELIGKTDFDFWSSETAKAAAEDEQRIMETKEAMVGKVERLVHPDGRVTWDYTTKMPLLDSSGNVIGICGINKDFTAMKEMQDALAEERNRLKATTAELEAKNAALQADLQLAREVQEALLPRDYPTFPGFGVSGQNALSFAHCYLPTALVGGDFFDIFPLSQTRAGILICDVMGHGLRAALVTAIIRALLEELRPMMHEAGRFLESLNLRLRAVLERVEEPFVATAFYLIADTAAKEVSFANAGHPVPCRLCRKAGTVEPISTAPEQIGPALGIFDSAKFPTSRAPFDQGDCIVMFTDGIFEVYSPEGQEFGKEALFSTFLRHASLPASELFAAVLKEALAFSSRSDFDDDVCLVAVERALD